jgi:hypothetical protein
MPHGPSGIVRNRPPVLVDEAHVDVDAIAHAIGVEDRREAGDVAEPSRRRARQFPHDHRRVGGAHALFRLDHRFDLRRRVLLHDAVGAQAGGAQRPGQRLAEGALGLEAAAPIGFVGDLGRALDLEFVLERRHEPHAGDPVEPVEGGFQDGPGAERPGLALQREDVAEHEALDVVFRKGDADIGGGVGHEQKVAERAERGFGDGVETGDLDVGRRPADAALQALFKLVRGKGLAAHLAGEIACGGEDERRRNHRADPPSAGRSASQASMRALVRSKSFSATRVAMASTTASAGA